MTNAELKREYPWLEMATTQEEYLAPEYYDRILKPYVFGGKSDLDFLCDSTRGVPADARILEFGPGTGRATRVVLDTVARPAKLTLVDSSKRMLAKCRELFGSHKAVSYTRSDTVDFMLSTDEHYDFVYSLWSFSHSVHQTLTGLGIAAGTSKVKKAMLKFLTQNLQPNGKFFLTHFDSLSEEQRISIRQRKRDNSVFTDTEQQSPSKLLVDEVLSGLRKTSKIDFTCTHLQGDPIIFNGLDEALEYYLNFHMESHFNSSPILPSVVEELKDDLNKHEQTDGTIAIRPGCFMYEVTRTK